MVSRTGCLMLCLALVGSPATTTAAADLATRIEQIHRTERTDSGAAVAALDLIIVDARRVGDVLAEGTAELHRAHALLLRGEFQPSLEAAVRARAILSGSFEQSPAMGSTLATLALMHELAGLYPEALELHEEAIRLLHTLDEPGRLSAALLNYGNLLDSVDNLEGAENAYRESLAVKRKAGLQRSVGSLLGNLGLLRLRQNRPEEAAMLFEQALEELAKEENPQATSNVLRHTARVLHGQGRLEEAEQRLRSAEQIANSADYRPGQSALAEVRAELMMGGVHGKPDRLSALRALALNQQALDLAKGAEPTRIASLLRQRAWIAEAAGEPAQALAALKELDKVEAEKRSDAAARRYALLSTRFAFERQVNEIALLKERAATQAAVLERAQWTRNSLIAGSVLLALLLLTLVTRFRQRRRDQALLAKQNLALSSALSEAETQRATAEEAVRLNRELMRIAAEDLRSPLMQMLGNSERLLMRASAQPELRHESAVIADSAQHLVHVVSNMVDSVELESPDQLRMQVQDMALIASECAEVYAPRAAEKRQGLKLSIHGPLPVNGDGLRLRQAVENLLSNAIKFSPPNRDVTIRAYAEDGVCVIEVQDQGPGLRKEDVQRIFGRFQRLSARPTAGERTTGLGLSLVKRIAELHGGSVSAQGLQSGGSAFCIRIPLCAKT